MKRTWNAKIKEGYSRRDLKLKCKGMQFRSSVLIRKIFFCLSDFKSKFIFQKWCIILYNSIYLLNCSYIWWLCVVKSIQTKFTDQNLSIVSLADEGKITIYLINRENKKFIMKCFQFLSNHLMFLLKCVFTIFWYYFYWEMAYYSINCLYPSLLPFRKRWYYYTMFITSILNTWLYSSKYVFLSFFYNPQFYFHSNSDL